jgi:hypothetical protein
MNIELLVQLGKLSDAEVKERLGTKEASLAKALNKPKSVSWKDHALSLRGFKNCEHCNCHYNKNKWCFCQVPKFPVGCEGRSGYERAKAMNLVPPWADLEAISKIYKRTPKGYHVDHIVPLSKGGLHTVENLQILTAYDNLSKGSTICIGFPASRKS